MKTVNTNEFVQELLVNLIEAFVNMHELKTGNMSLEMGAELVHIGDKLSDMLNDFVAMNK